MTRGNVNFIWWDRRGNVHTLFLDRHKGDQYPRGLRDFYNVLDFVRGEWTPKNFRKWIRENYEPAEAVDGEGRCLDGFDTDYTYTFEAMRKEKKAIVWNWADKVFEGNDKEFIEWIEKQK